MTAAPSFRVPRRVLHVVGSMGLGGAEAMLMNVYRATDRDRLQFDFLVFGSTPGAHEDEIVRLGGRVLRMDRPQRTGLRFVLDLARLLRQHGPFAAVHSHINFASVLPLSAARLAGVPVRVAHSHSTADSSNAPLRGTYNAVSRWGIVQSATALVACGEEAGRHLYSRAWARGSVIPNTIEVDAFLPSSASRRREVRTALGLSDAEIVVGVVGRLTPVKNHAFLLDLLVRASQEAFPVVAVVVGQGELEGQLVARGRALGVDQMVTFLGPRRDVPDLMQAFDVLAMPSLHEGMPVTLVESQAAGLPAFVSDRVTREIDLGLGLLTFLPLEQPDMWLERMRSQLPAQRVGVEDIRDALERRGYTAAQAASAFGDLYRVSS